MEIESIFEYAGGTQLTFDKEIEIEEGFIYIKGFIHNREELIDTLNASF